MYTASAKHAPPQTEMSGFLPRFFFLFLFPYSHPSLPIHHYPPSPSKYDIFLEVQQQPLVELRSCVSLSTVVQETLSILSTKRKTYPCGHTCSLFLWVRGQNTIPERQTLHFVMVMRPISVAGVLNKKIYVTNDKHLPQMSH